MGNFNIKNEKLLWWHRAIIYQIYPRSFQDSNDDGIGDLKGIVQRLPYLQELGIEAIWLSPIFPSPMADFGYDVADYEGISSLFGTMTDFDELLEDVHNRGMKLLLDLVPNHSSSEHPWFKESRSSKDNSKRDWYIWKDALPDGSVPNNWLSVFGGSAWEWDEHTNQYYYHGFLKEQPDLNWRNPKVVDAMMEVIRFWLDKGVDGFRVDVLWHIFKDQNFPDNPPNPVFLPNMPSYEQLLPIHSTDQPEVMEVVKQMRKLTDLYKDRVIIGEIYLPIEKLMTYYGENSNGIHLPFNFMLLSLPWKSQLIAASINEYETALPNNAWPNWVLSNHDRPRLATRIGMAQARVAAMLLLTLRGTPTLYYGDEIGMNDVEIPIAEMQDPQGLRMPELNMSRDPVRTPMQWDASANAGFSTHRPWLRLAQDYESKNVSVQLKDEASMLTLYRKLIALRQQEHSLLFGNYQLIFVNEQLLAYTRKSEGNDGFLIILNLSNSAAKFEIDELMKGTLLFTVTGQNYNWNVGELIIAAAEGVIVKLTDK